MKFRKVNKTDDKPEELLDKAYNCNNNELQVLLEKIETKIKSEGNNELLSRAKSVITTKIILKKEDNTKVYSK